MFFDAVSKQDPSFFALGNSEQFRISAVHGRTAQNQLRQVIDLVSQARTCAELGVQRKIEEFKGRIFQSFFIELCQWKKKPLFAQKMLDYQFPRYQMKEIDSE